MVFTCLLVLIFLCAEGISPNTTTVLKIGCAPLTLIPPCGVYDDQCKNYDSNCPLGEICCKVHCGTACKKPGPVSSKPWVYPTHGAFMPCGNKCNTDYDCEGIKKCCSNGCGYECLEPLKPKLGVCQTLPPDTSGICADYCYEDKHCPGAEKCCSHGCGKSCQASV